MPQPPENDFGGGTPPLVSTTPPPLAQTGSDADWDAASQYYQSIAPGGSPLLKMPPQSGAANDTVWGSLKTAIGRIAAKTGESMADNLNSQQFGISPEVHDSLSKLGLINGFNDDHKTFVKSANEVLIRNAILAAQAIPAAFGAVLGGAQGAATQTAAQIEGNAPNALQKAAAYPFKAVGEAAEDIQGGALMGEGFGLAEEAVTAKGAGVVLAGREAEQARMAAVQSEHLSAATQGRALGALGEGEAGYFDAAEPTPENAQARAQSAQEAGIEVPPPMPAPDIHELARRVDPETFAQYDALAAERDQHRQTLVNLGAEREVSPEAVAAKAAIDDLIGGATRTVAERERRVDALRASAPDEVLHRLNDAQQRLEDALTRDTPEMTAARSALMDADFKMRDLAPEVSDAYRRATDMAPELAEADSAKPVTGKVEGEKPAAPAVEGAPQKLPPETIKASGEAAGFEPASVTGEQKLGAPGEGSAEPSDEIHAGVQEEGQASTTPSAVKTFKTAKGSTYELHEDGTTTRDKVARSDAGHEGDEGVKPRSAKTVYVDTPEQASSLSAAGLKGLGEKGARVILKDGKASLLTWNEKAGKWGRSSNGKDIPVHDTPAVGRAPLELWKSTDDVPGHEAYSNMHAGNAITEVEHAPVIKTAGARYGNLRAVEGTGELQTRGLSENVEAKAIEDGLTQTFGDLPEYRQLSMADQAERVSKLMDEDYDTAKAIAMGDRQPPKGILPESVYVGVERRATAEGDIDTLQQLATRSKLTASATTMGQRIRTLGERDKASPVGMIQEVQAAREADLARRSGDVQAAKAAEVKAIRAEVKRTASKPDAWNAFIKSITCGE